MENIASLEFSIEEHNKRFINYLEVMILRDGTVKYAVPSHQLFLINKYLEEYNITQDELNHLIPMHEAPLDWLINEMGIVSVWNCLLLFPANPTKEQLKTARELINANLMSPNYSINRVIKNRYGNLVHLPYIF